jgi:hypothetical protein
VLTPGCPVSVCECEQIGEQIAALGRSRARSPPRRSVSHETPQIGCGGRDRHAGYCSGSVWVFGGAPIECPGEQPSDESKYSEHDDSSHAQQ